MPELKAPKAILQPPQNRIRVLECIRQGIIGGGESHLLSLMENLDQSVFEPIVLSFTDGPMIGHLQKMNVETHIIPTVKPFDFAVWGKIRNLLKQKRIQIVHAHGSKANSNIIWAARSLGIPVVYTVHGWSFHQDQHPLIRHGRILAERFLVAKSNLTISVSKSNRESGKKHIQSLNSIVINNGIDGKKFNPDRKHTDIKKELGICNKDLLVLFIARFTEHKQPLSLLEAFINALPNQPDMHLLMVGEGDQQNMAMEKVKLLGLEHKVSFQSFRQDVPDILAAADIFVLPSLWEGLPIGLLEAMAMGKAVIATRVDGTVEIVENGVNGILIETNNLISHLTDALLMLSKDYMLRHELSRNAIETVKGKFNASIMTTQVENAYLKIYKNPKQFKPLVSI